MPATAGFAQKCVKNCRVKAMQSLYKLDFNDGISTFDNPESFTWIHNESASVGDLLMWRKSQNFDQSSRLLEELFIDRNLIAYTTIYKYVAKDSKPIAAEFLTDNRFMYKRWYRYDEHDAQGNWTKRTTVKVEPQNPDYQSETKRNITYY